MEATGGEDIPYLLKEGIRLVGTESSVLRSSSKYLNDPRLREWLAFIALRKNGPDYPPAAEMHTLIEIWEDIRDDDHVNALFAEERKVNPALDRWFDEGFLSTFRVPDLAGYPEGSLGRIFHDRMVERGFDLDIVPFREPTNDFEFFQVRAGQCHDLEHIILGGGFDYMGELVPFWFRMTNVFKHLHSQELAGELSVLSILGSLRYTVRTLLHYPEIWLTCVDAIRRGQRTGLESGPVFLARYEDVFHLPIDEAREALGVRGVEERDTHEAGEIFAGRLDPRAARA